jgi:3-phosphoshikimate 1-carboxyvinyltransferase
LSPAGRSGPARPLAPLGAFDAKLRPPGDKSISHRALLFSAVARGESRIARLSRSRDVGSTAAALRRLGVTIREPATDVTVVSGRGWRALDRHPADPELQLECGNSGTTARLLAGLLAGRRGRFRLTGDDSLSRRPMGRVVEPLALMGAAIEGGPRLPLIVGGGELDCDGLGFEVSSAQVKGALILAGLQARGRLSIECRSPMRDHSERMLAAMRAGIRREPGPPERIEVCGGAVDLEPLDVVVPGDPSSAAPFIALACAIPGARIEVVDVSLNETRLGFLRLLAEMGARISIGSGGGDVEPGGTIVAEGSALRGIDVDAGRAADAIDELPLLAVVATAARGKTTIRGAEELRLKESDRIAQTVRLLDSFGARVAELEDGLVVEGGGRLSGASVSCGGDHRIAMCAAVAAALSERGSRLAGDDCVAISYPGFFDDLALLHESAPGGAL